MRIFHNSLIISTVVIQYLQEMQGGVIIATNNSSASNKPSEKKRKVSIPLNTTTNQQKYIERKFKTFQSYKGNANFRQQNEACKSELITQDQYNVIENQEQDSRKHNEITLIYNKIIKISRIALQ